MRGPLLFVGHGSPMNVILDNRFTRQWKNLGGKIDKPKAVIGISAHWYADGSYVGTDNPYRQIYDMAGFPKEVYEVNYEASFDEELFHKIKGIFGDEIRVDNSWGLDHGLWSVTNFIWPDGDVPFVLLSVNASLAPEEMYAFGEKLSSLRDEGYMIVCSGNIVHNLMLVDWDKTSLVKKAEEFDNLVEGYIRDKNYGPLLAYRKLPNSKLAFFSPDHYLPLIYALGAVKEDDRLEVFNKGGELGYISMTSYLWT